MSRACLCTVAAALLAVTPIAAQRNRGVIVVPGQVTQVISDTMGTAYEVGAPPAMVFHALALAYGDLKVETPIRDSALLQVGNPQFYRRGDLGGRQISTWLGCGDGITGPYADSYRVYMSLVTSITPVEGNPDRAIVRTVLLAGAVNVSEGARQAMPCESTGRLEVRIHQLTLRRLAVP